MGGYELFGLFLTYGFTEDPEYPMAIQCDEKLCHPLGCESIQLWGINEMLMRQIYKQSCDQ
ncbi:hypothetical protein IGI04_026825 [Brassica rapa subsp. trilocularis]|uniref:Uncharacterized protein n=1 Tax=Brassica rapa subsp. trilocularis TaxID=1813537 RepID=A0ABQ7KX67_BRACM|nr:hypothetical protein IGI04_026825 [Brassica rapa subsp. trilocularis]